MFTEIHKTSKMIQRKDPQRSRFDFSLKMIQKKLWPADHFRPNEPTSELSFPGGEQSYEAKTWGETIRDVGEIEKKVLFKSVYYRSFVFLKMEQSWAISSDWDHVHNII